jgi:hypothetical protein
MSKNIGYGDKLARGAVKATYPATEGGIAADKWAQAFDDFDPEAFKNAPNKTQQRSGDADGDATGDAGIESGEVSGVPQAT